MGTDTVTGVLYARRYYGAEMAGFSIPASEHSTMTAWGVEREAEAYSNMIDRFAGGGMFAVVSDNYDINYAVSEIWGEQLREKVRASGGTVVVRPDSGDPIETPVHVIKQLDYHFGSTLNGKGYKVLDKSVPGDPGRRHFHRRYQPDPRPAGSLRLFSGKYRLRHGRRAVAEGQSRYLFLRHENQCAARRDRHMA